MIKYDKLTCMLLWLVKKRNLKKSGYSEVKVSEMLLPSEHDSDEELRETIKTYHPHLMNIGIDMEGV